MQDILLAQDWEVEKVQMLTGSLQWDRSGAILFLDLDDGYTGEFMIIRQTIYLWFVHFSLYMSYFNKKFTW